MERLTNAYVKGRIDENYYDKEYERLQSIIQESEYTETENRFDVKRLEEIFNADWQKAYDNVSRENKRMFWKNIIRSIHFNTDKTVKSIDFL